MSTFFKLLRTSSPQILQKMCSRPSGHQTLLIRFPKSTLHCLRPLFTVQLYSHCFIKWILRRILNYLWTVRHRVVKRVTILHSRKKICTFQLWWLAFWTFQIPSTWLYILSKQVYIFRIKWPYNEICIRFSFILFYLYAANICSIRCVTLNVHNILTRNKKVSAEIESRFVYQANWYMSVLWRVTTLNFTWHQLSALDGCVFVITKRHSVSDPSLPFIECVMQGQSKLIYLGVQVSRHYFSRNLIPVETVIWSERLVNFTVSTWFKTAINPEIFFLYNVCDFHTCKIIFITYFFFLWNLMSV
jgi:hypothetical protein